ncbi:hypothetical protein [Ottowia sp.]|uniref:hypothetical protein n=1 Tax=Ottowia sp. TaxID=1898956 RepID=UPI0025FF44B5|nr:hypothetical protein [Ottowia sp.]MBK6616359.1 hypothetical protein [Ottowia sp.]
MASSKPAFKQGVENMSKRKLVVRWDDSQRIRRCLANNSIAASWTHLVPQLGRTRQGICCDPRLGCDWKAPGRSVGLVLDIARLPASTKWFEFDGNAVHDLTDRLTWTFDAEERKRLVDESASDPRYTRSRDELFIAGHIRHLSGCMVAFWIRDQRGRELGAKTAADVGAFAASHGLPIYRFDPMYSDRREVSLEWMASQIDGAESGLELEVEAAA